MSRSRCPNGGAGPQVADPFKILVLPYTATPAEVAAAFRRVALATHPDTNPGSDGAAFRAARAAYDALRNNLDDERTRWKPAPSMDEEVWMRTQWKGRLATFDVPAGAGPPTRQQHNVPLDFPLCYRIVANGNTLFVPGPPFDWRPGTTPPSGCVHAHNFTGTANGVAYGAWRLPGGDVSLHVYGPAGP